MLGIMNHVIRTATRSQTAYESGFEKDRRIREAERLAREEARNADWRRVHGKISL